MSVIFVDRVLDLVSATDCSSGNFFDRLFHTLPRLHEYSNDVAVGTRSTKSDQNAEFTRAPACLAPQSDGKESSKRMEILLEASTDKAVDQISGLLASADGDQTSPLDNILIERAKDWDFIGENCHLFQVDEHDNNFIL